MIRRRVLYLLMRLTPSARSANGGGMSGNDEREQTLNQLLTEMDGFDGKKGVVILAATNRPESLDKALLRPGRFDRRVPVELPDLKGREAILKVHGQNVKMSEDVDYNAIARATGRRQRRGAGQYHQRGSPAGSAYGPQRRGAGRPGGKRGDGYCRIPEEKMRLFPRRSAESWRTMRWAMRWWLPARATAPRFRRLPLYPGHRGHWDIPCRWNRESATL